MIKINLANRKSAAAGSGSGSSVGGMSAGLDVSEVNKQVLRAVLLGAAAYMGCNYWLDEQKAELMAGLQAKSQDIEKRTTELQTSLSKFKQYEELKKALDTDEKLIKTKLDTILKLSSDKSVNVQILKTLSSSLPSEVWLSSYKVSQSELELRGNALDFNLVSDFMKRLSESDLITDVQLLNTNQSKDEKGVSVATFEVKAKRKY